MSKRILLLSPFFHPEPIGIGKYNSFLAQSLIRKGYKVEVVCFHPLYPEWRPNHSKADLPGVSILRGGKILRFPKNGVLRRAVLECSFLAYTMRNLPMIRMHTHIVAVLPPMIYLPMMWIACRPQTKITAIALDVQGIMAGVAAGREHGAVVRLVRIIEAAVLRCCHRVIALSRGMASFLSGTYGLPSSKIGVCWPFVTMNHLDSKGRLGHLFTQDKKHVVYAGAMGEKQNPDGLVSFFAHLAERNKEIICHVFSGGPNFRYLKRQYENAGPGLVFHDFIPERHLYELFQRSDIQIIPEKPGYSNGAFPSKLPNLLVSGVPILYIGQKESDVWQVIEKTQAGLCSDDWSFRHLESLVSRLLMDGHRQTRDERRRLFVENYSRQFNVEALIREIAR